jgi:hypothetical protein
MNFLLFELSKIKFKDDNNNVSNTILVNNKNLQANKTNLNLKNDVNDNSNNNNNNNNNQNLKDSISDDVKDYTENVNSDRITSDYDNYNINNNRVKKNLLKKIDLNKNKNKQKQIQNINQNINRNQNLKQDQTLSQKNIKNQNFLDLNKKEINFHIPNNNKDNNNNSTNTNKDTNIKSNSIDLNFIEINNHKKIKYENYRFKVYQINTNTNSNTKTNINTNDEIKIVNLEDIEIKSNGKYMGTIIIILSVILRKILSRINNSTAKWLVKFEKNTEQSTDEDRFLLYVVLYEFINYYFNLFYLIFYKQHNNLCKDNNCYEELGHNLRTILITATLINFNELFLPYISVIIRKLTNLFSNKEKKKKFTFKISLNPRNNFYDKIEYDDVMTEEYLELIMNFGYIILFGISAPICFFMAYIYALAERFTDGLKITQSHNIKIIGIFSFKILLFFF